MDSLQFSSIQNTGDIEKDVPVTPEIVTEEDLSFEKTADLYYNRVFTVVPKEHNPKLGILPEDQGFSRKYVFLWDTYRSLLPFSSKTWKKLSIKLPESVKFTQLRRLPGNDGYALYQIPNTWKIEEPASTPLYVE